MVSIMIDDIPYAPKQFGALPSIPDITQYDQPSGPEVVAIQQQQAADIKEDLQTQAVREAQDAAQGYATPPGSSFELLPPNYKAVGGIPKPATNAGGGVLWLALGGLALLFLMRR